MKAVIYFLFVGNTDNNLENIQKHITYDVKQFIITDVINPNKSIYNKIENIFYFKDKNSCLKNITNVVQYLEHFNYREVLLLNSEKNYTPDQLVYKDILTVKNEFTVVTKIL